MKRNFGGAFMSKYMCLLGILLFPFSFLLAESPTKIIKKIENKLICQE
jgi:hypothetical protein